MFSIKKASLLPLLLLLASCGVGSRPSVSADRSNSLSIQELRLFYGNESDLLKAAVKARNKKHVDLIIEYGVSDHQLFSVFTYALFNKNIEMSKFLISKNNEIVALVYKYGEYKRGPNMFDLYVYDGDTPLHIAAREGLVDVVDELLKAGANPNVKNILGQTPLDRTVNTIIKNLLVNSNGK